MSTIGNLAVKLSLSTAQFTGGLGTAAKSVGGFTSSIAGFAAKTALAGVALAGVGSIGAGLAFGVKIAAEAEQAAVAFRVLLGSEEAAKKTLADITSFAASTPFQLPELRDAARSLAAFGLSADQIVPNLKMLGDIAAGTNQPIGELAEIFGKAKVQGRLFMEDINQLTGRGIPVITELAKVFGVPASSIRKMVEDGKINFSHLQQAMVNMTTAAGPPAAGLANVFAGIAGRGQVMAADLDKLSAGGVPAIAALATAFGVPEDKIKELAAGGKIGFGELQKALGAAGGGIGVEMGAIFARIKEQGKLFESDLTDLSTQGVPALAALAKQFKVPEDQVKALAAAGKISFADVQAAMATAGAAGGQFAGLTAAQSKTVSGLWSTLTDNVGLALGGIAGTIMDAFDVRGALTGLSDLTSGLQESFTPIVTKVAAIVKQTWAAVAEPLGRVFSLIFGEGIPSFEAIGAVGVQIFGTIQSAIQAVFGVVNLLMDGIAVLANWIASLFGGTALGAIGDFKDVLLGAFIAAEFAFKNWQDVGLLVLSKIGLALISFGLDAAHLFTHTLPELWSFYKDNSMDILTTIAANTLTLFENLASNVAAIFKNLPALLSGNLNLSDLWQPLTQGFVNTVKELPALSKRELTGLEKDIQAEIGGLEGKLGPGFDAFLQQRLGEFDAAAATIEKGTADAAAAVDQVKIDASANGPAGKGEKKEVAALQLGGSQTFDAISKAIAGDQKDKAAEIAKQQLEQQKEQTAQLTKLADKQTKLVVAKF